MNFNKGKERLLFVLERDRVCVEKSTDNSIEKSPSLSSLTIPPPFLKLLYHTFGKNSTIFQRTKRTV